MAQRLKCLPGRQETRVWTLGREDPLEKEMATHSSTLAWRIPWREEPGRLQSTGAQRVGHDWTLIHAKVEITWTSLVAQRLKCLPGMQETRVWTLGREDPLEKEMATHSSTLAWRIPWSEEPGTLPSMGSQRVGHDWATSLHVRSFLHKNSDFSLIMRKISANSSWRKFCKN